MKSRTNILNQQRSLFIWYTVVLFCCFVGVYFVAGPYSLIQICDDGIHYFDQVRCGHGIDPLIVNMNAETLDVHVGSYMPPLSYTENVGWHVMGTDALGRDVFAGVLYGGQRSLLIGLLSGGLAMVMGWFIGLWSVFVRWSRSKVPYFWIGIMVLLVLAWLTHIYMITLLALGMIIFRFWMGRYSNRSEAGSLAPWMWGRWIEWYQALPDLLLILVLSAAIGVLNVWSLMFIIIAVIWPSMALIARRVGTEVSQQTYFKQALRNKVSPKNLIVHYLWGNTRSVFKALFPLVVARVILLESTISFLGLGLPPDIVTIGSMISEARQNMSAWWLIVFSGLFIFILVYPLLRLGAGIRR